MRFNKKQSSFRFLAFLMAAALLLHPISIYATSISGLDQKIKEDKSAISDAKDEKDSLQNGLDAAQNKKEELEVAKQQLTGKVMELDDQIRGVSNDLSDVEQLLETKKEEIKEAKIQLEQAKKDIEEQYKNMKIRMKFMYEHGSMTYIQILLSCETFSEMLNKAEYIEQVSEYDRDMLEKFKQTKEEVAAMEKDLSSQEVVLEETKKSIEEKQDEMQNLMDEKIDEIHKYEKDIANKEAAIEEYENMIKEQDAQIRALEAAVAAAQAERERLNSISQNSVKRPTYGGGQFCWPAPSYTRISDEYGYRIHPILNVEQYHNGLDMAAPYGSSILAAADGVVVAAAYSSTMGNYVMIDHGGGLYTIYMHASSLSVSEGQSVTKGAKIGGVGSTGRSTGNHLHFSVRLNGSYVSPWQYL